MTETYDPRSEPSDFELRIRRLQQQVPGASLAWALQMMDGDTDKLLGVTRREVAEWILEQSEIVAMLKDRKINAIKEVRAATQLGLKEAKEAVEEAVYLLDNGYMSKQEREQLEVEERAAISSILGH